VSVTIKEIDPADLPEHKRKAIMEFVLVLRMFRKTGLKIGGKEKIKALLDHLQALPMSKQADFLKGIAERKEGVQNILAYAMAGLIAMQLALTVDYGNDEE